MKFAFDLHNSNAAPGVRTRHERVLGKASESRHAACPFPRSPWACGSCRPYPINISVCVTSPLPHVRLLHRSPYTRFFHLSVCTVDTLGLISIVLSFSLLLFYQSRLPRRESCLQFWEKAQVLLISDFKPKLFSILLPSLLFCSSLHHHNKSLVFLLHHLYSTFSWLIQRLIPVSANTNANPITQCFIK